MQNRNATRVRADVVNASYVKAVCDQAKNSSLDVSDLMIQGPVKTYTAMLDLLNMQDTLLMLRKDLKNIKITGFAKEPGDAAVNLTKTVNTRLKDLVRTYVCFRAPAHTHTRARTITTLRTNTPAQIGLGSVGLVTS